MKDEYGIEIKEGCTLQNLNAQTMDEIWDKIWVYARENGIDEDDLEIDY